MPRASPRWGSPRQNPSSSQRGTPIRGSRRRYGSRSGERLIAHARWRSHMAALDRCYLASSCRRAPITERVGRISEASIDLDQEVGTSGSHRFCEFRQARLVQHVDNVTILEAYDPAAAKLSRCPADDFEGERDSRRYPNASSATRFVRFAGHAGGRAAEGHGGTSPAAPLHRAW
jgi:hypothetical protein